MPRKQVAETTAAPAYEDGLPFHMDVADWLAEAARRFGNEPNKWVFQCPVCGNQQTGQQFKDVGAEPQSVYQECIGRHLKNPARDFASVPGANGKTSPCDYAAYGLFRALRGHLVKSAQGNEVPVFPFAPGGQDA